MVATHYTEKDQRSSMPLPWNRSSVATDQQEPVRARGHRGRRQIRGEEVQRHNARLEEERRRQRLAFTIGGMLLLLIFSIVGVGYFREFYQPPRAMAGAIRGVEFKMGDLVERIRVLQGINRNHPQGAGFIDLSVIPFEYLQNMLNAEILRQASPGLGISISDEDVDAELKRQFDPPTPPSGQVPDEGQLEEEFRERYNDFLSRTGLSDEAYQVIVKEQLSELQLRFFLSQDIPSVLEQVEVEWIRLEFGGAVIPEDVRTRLEREDFSVVAADAGVPTGQATTPAPRFADRNGYVGWVPKGAFPGLDDTLFGNDEQEIVALTKDAISDPVSTQDGIYIIHKLSSLEEQPLSSAMLFKMNTEQLTTWRNGQLDRGSEEGWLQINFNSDLYAWVADQVRLTRPRVERNQAQQQGG